MKSRRIRLIITSITAILAVLGVIVVAQLAANRSGVDAGAQGAGIPAANTLIRQDPKDPLALGDINAPVVMIEWTDLSCPYCAVFSRETLPAIIEEYVDTGKVRVEFHDVSFFGTDSEAAAVAVRAAGQQGKAVDYLQALYAATPERGPSEMPRETLIGFAREVGVSDIASFAASLDDPHLLAAVQQSTNTAQQVGVNSVPFFLAEGRTLSGAQPIAVFREFLDAAVLAAQ